MGLLARGIRWIVGSYVKLCAGGLLSRNVDKRVLLNIASPSVSPKLVHLRAWLIAVCGVCLSSGFEILGKLGDLYRATLSPMPATSNASSPNGSGDAG